MARSIRIVPGGMVFHVLNRGVGRQRIFSKQGDYVAFEKIMEETLAQSPMRICAYCLMPTHWHMVLWPEQDDDLPMFMKRLTVTHAVRWQKHRKLVGTGHVYQNRYKSFPVENDSHFYTVVRYVERNALRANLVQRAENWQWSSLWRRLHGSEKEKALLSSWPLELPTNWSDLVNEPHTNDELETLRLCIQRGQPYGSGTWMQETIETLGLESTLRLPGRPRRNMLTLAN
jgi:putative transposase